LNWPNRPIIETQHYYLGHQTARGIIYHSILLKLGLPRQKKLAEESSHTFPPVIHQAIPWQWGGWGKEKNVCVLSTKFKGCSTSMPWAESPFSFSFSVTPQHVLLFSLCARFCACPELCTQLRVLELYTQNPKTWMEGIGSHFEVRCHNQHKHCRSNSCKGPFAFPPCGCVMCSVSRACTQVLTSKHRVLGIRSFRLEFLVVLVAASWWFFM
jgi:hypothetical protein